VFRGCTKLPNEIHSIESSMSRWNQAASMAPLPEPGTAGLVAMALGALVGLRRAA
jgi:hypothetical protein